MAHPNIPVLLAPAPQKLSTNSVHDLNTLSQTSDIAS
jgi:hypothetical protein